MSTFANFLAVLCCVAFAYVAGMGHVVTGKRVTLI